MNISLNPTYYCNFRCDFCYLTKEQLCDKQLLSIDKLNEQLLELRLFTTIDHVDLYGGEPMLLPKSYINELKSCLLYHGVQKVNVNTNLSCINQSFLDPFFDLSVSYDFTAREKHDVVWRNMALLDNDFSVLMLASDRLIQLDPDEMISQFNLLSNLVSVEIKPYSSNQANQLKVTNKQYETFVQKWIESPVEKKFEFVNEFLIQDVLDKTRNSFSDDHIYITPTGKFAVLEFDSNDNEYFKECQSFRDYLEWCHYEKERVSKNKFCSSCEYYGHCLSEHLREVKDMTDGCNGFKGLIDWYGNNYSK